MEKIYLIKLGFGGEKKGMLNTELVYDDPRERDKEYHEYQEKLGKIIRNDKISTDLLLLYVLKAEAFVNKPGEVPK